MNDRPGIWLALALVGLVIAGIGALRGGATVAETGAMDATQTVEPRDVVAWVNGVPIERGTLQAWQAAARREGDTQSGDELLQAVIDQELIYQEGVRQGLLQSDPVIRRRVIQLMAEQLGAATGEPDEEQLARFYAEHASWYTRPAQVRFTQIFLPAGRVAPDRVTAAFGGVRPGMDLAAFQAAARRAPDRLRAHSDDLYYPYDRLIALYGPEFAARLQAVSPGRVTGPLKSSLGWHMVAVLERVEPQRRPLAQVRNIVARDWRRTQQSEAVRAWLERARSQADIRIESQVTQ